MLKEIACAGSAAVTTVSFIHPIDVVKTRLQVYGGSIGSTISGTIANEGAGALYNGITAAWLREASYTSLRLGLYAPIKEITGAKVSPLVSCVCPPSWWRALRNTPLPPSLLHNK